MIAHFVSHIHTILKSGSLRGRILKGGALVGMGSAIEQAVRFLRNMLLTRLLMPEQLGTMAIILAVNMALESFTEVGIREAVIQNPRSTEKKYLNTIFWFALARSLIIAACGFALAPLLGSFYHIAHVNYLMQISFIAIIFNGAMSPRAYLALKHMHYGRWVGIMQGAALIGVISTIVLVFWLRDIRALIAGYVIEAALRCILSYIFCPFLPGIASSKEHRSALFNFAKGMAGVPLLNFIFMQADIFVLGKLVTTAKIGIYGMAVSLAAIPALLVAVFINPILTPVFAEIGSDRSRVNDALLRVTALLAILGFPLCLAAFFGGNDVMYLVYGAPYREAGIAFAILFTGSFIRTIAAPIPTVYLGLGKPALSRSFSAIRTIILCALIVPAAYYGNMRGAALASVVAMTIAWVFQLRQVHKLTGMLPAHYLSALQKGIVPCVPILIAGIVSLYLGSASARLTSIGLGIAFAGALSFTSFKSVFIESPENAALPKAAV